MKTLPRGIRNDNPGNIELGQHWQGLSHAQSDGRFAQFDSPVFGLRALMKVLLTYKRKYGLTLVADIIRRWAPAIENDTLSYAYAVRHELGLRTGDETDLEHPDTLIKFAKAITVHENGRPPPGVPDHWYDDSLYAEAARLALS